MLVLPDCRCYIQRMDTLPTAAATEADDDALFERTEEEAMFPSDEPFNDHVAITKIRLEARLTLYCSIGEMFDNITLGSNQFLYYDANDPQKRLNPDIFVKTDTCLADFDCWMTWKDGVPQLAIEIVHGPDTLKLAWEEKLARYEASGVLEIVRFEPQGDKPIRIWDRIDGVFVERRPNSHGTNECKTLGLYWTLRTSEDFGVQLRLAMDRSGTEILLTPEEELALLRAELAAEENAQSHVEEVEA
jgi:hypothetical protein